MTRHIIDNELLCRTCKQWLPIEYFSVNRQMKHDRDGQCRTCRSLNRPSERKRYTGERRVKQIVYATTWNNKHREQIRQYQRAYRREAQQISGVCAKTAVA